jgi:hypothetical protein
MAHNDSIWNRSNTSSSSRLLQVNPRLSENHTCRTLCEQTWGMELKDLLWHEICSEYDARRFAHYFHSSKIELSTEFLRFERSWLGDEENHYRGFLNIYSTLFKVPSAKLTSLVRVRRSGFSQITHFVQDEFHLCILLAYDEIVTGNGYATDFPIYDALGDPTLSTWIRTVCREEVHHFRNAIELLRFHYASRLSEISDILAELVNHDSQLADYSGTFVLDHQHYPPSLLKRAHRAVVNACNVRMC